MDIDSFKQKVYFLKVAIANLETLNKSRVERNPLQDYSSAKATHYRNSLQTTFDLFQSNLKTLKKSTGDADTDMTMETIAKLGEQITLHDFNDAKQKLDKILMLLADIKITGVKSFRLKGRIPVELLEVLQADADELDRCFKAGCYRSAIILCGRIMETALHRKYFDVTGNDLLEKAPGIGLGNLIAKLAENSVLMEPGLANQIHLINQVRVFSVHIKQQSFAPTQQQAEAIILYTLDVVEKLFG